MGAFQVLRPSNTFKKKAEVIAKADFVGQYILSPARVLTPEEELTVPVLPDWYIIPKEVKRICEHAKVTTDTVQPMRNFLLRGPAGTGKNGRSQGNRFRASSSLPVPDLLRKYRGI